MDEIWEQTTEFVDSVKEMDSNVKRLVEFYSKHKKEAQKQQLRHSETSLTDEKPILSPLARAKLELSIVFAINACYWIYLVTHGEDPKKNEISKDIDRIRLFMNRAKEVEDSLPDSDSSAKRPKIDKEASKRLCLNNMSR